MPMPNQQASRKSTKRHSRGAAIKTYPLRFKKCINNRPKSSAIFGAQRLDGKGQPKSVITHNASRGRRYRNKTRPNIIRRDLQGAGELDNSLNVEGIFLIQIVAKGALRTPLTQMSNLLLG